eukprot:scaffold11_cov257-Pinguiococcus_pyrenoidosus.AAC.49
MSPKMHASSSALYLHSDSDQLQRRLSSRTTALWPASAATHSAVRFWLSVAFLAFRHSRRETTSSRPCAAAASSGVVSLKPGAPSTSAPWSSKSFTDGACPHLDAARRGVAPLCVTASSCVERSISALALRVDSCSVPAVEQERHDRDLSALARKVQRCQAIQILGVDVRTGLQQQASNFFLSPPCCRMERSDASRILAGDVRTGIQQQSSELDATKKSRQIKRTPPPFMRRIDVDFHAEQLSNSSEVTKDASHMQLTETVPLRAMVPTQQAHDVELACIERCAQRRPSVLCL